LQKGNKFALISTGTIGNNAVEAFKECPSSEWSHYHFLFVKPLNEEVLHEIFGKHQKVVTLEEGTVIGGFGSRIAQFAALHYPGICVEVLGIKDEFVEHATVKQQQQQCGIDTESIKEIINSY
jgi:1-deoxy-D-xylulose-5-phosphate synthase